MFDFIRGPLLWVAFIVFFGGLVFQLLQFFTLTRKKERLFLSVHGKTKGRWSIESVRQWFESLLTTIRGVTALLTLVNSTGG